MPDKRSAIPPIPGPTPPEPRGSDPWSDETWGQNALNVTFETVETDVFEFSAEGSTDHKNDGNASFDNEFQLFRAGDNNNDAKARDVGLHQQQQDRAETPLVAVAVHEQLSATYNDTSDEPSCHLEGSVYVRAMSDMSRHPFCLVVRDL